MTRTFMRASNSTPVKIIIALVVFASALYLAWAGYGFGRWLKHITD